MSVASKRTLRGLLLACIYMLAVLGIVASGGGSGGGGDSDPAPESEKCVLDSSKIGDCKI